MRDVIRSLIRSNGAFVELSAFEGKLPDTEYVEGAIECSLDGQNIFTTAEWDLVDQLWAYIIDGLKEAKLGRQYDGYFPDQPLRLAFIPIGPDQVQVVVGRRVYSVRLRRLLVTMQAGAIEFFDKMRALNKAADDTWARYSDAARSLTEKD